MKRGAKRGGGGARSTGDRRGRRSRRAVVAVVLLGFVLVATGVIARRSYGIDQARTVRDLERRRQALDAQRMQLDGEIREATSRSRLAPIAERRLNMRVPSPEQVIMLTQPRLPPDTPRAARPSPANSIARRP
jgi:cell division protein FtsL